LAFALLGAGTAQAGEWIQASCQNPNGSAAPSDGWSVGELNSPGDGSSNSTRCAPGTPMYAILSTAVAERVGTTEYLEYAPPAGSTLTGGTVNVNLYADGYGPGASGTAVLYEPALTYPGDVFFQCAQSAEYCHGDTYDYSGLISLPSGAGGDFYIAAGCGGQAGQSCDSGGSHNAYALVHVNAADFLLSNSSAPQASDFSGSALQSRVSGTAHVVFTASDPAGPGIYRVTVQVGSSTVWSGTPSTDDGRCVPAGSSGGVLIFDWQQPCQQTEVVDAPVPTRGLSDGSHELAVTVTDAAGNSSTVLDQTISTSNPNSAPTPRGRHSVHAHFLFYWRWNAARTELYRMTITGMPRRARLQITCSGRGCHAPTFHTTIAHGRWLVSETGHRSFRAGDRLLITVKAPNLKAERIKIMIRNGSKPTTRLL
jgi:hypothetical protein